ncbi:MAG: hypothetical protein Q4P15_08970 [Propionibacteriaceae bacterium]|nr:hypothetical protein [Propionibacteriaceae bacterium]
MSYLFALTGVRPPDTDPGQLASVGSRWQTTASAMGGELSSISAAISAVAATNSGPAASAFAAAMTGSGSGQHQLGQFAKDGADVGQACAGAARSLAQTSLAMRVVAMRGEVVIRQLIATGGIGAALKILTVVRHTRSSLQQVEGQGHQAIAQALSAVHFAGGGPAMLPQDGDPSLPSEVDGYNVGGPQRPDITFDEDFDFDSDSPTFDDYVNWQKWNAIRLAGLAHPGLDDASVMYDHYMGASGEPRTFDLDEAIEEDSLVNRYTRDEISRTASAVDSLAAGRTEFQVSGPAHGTQFQPETENWQKTIGAYQQWSSANVTVENGMVTMEITVHAEDRWNFNRGAFDVETGYPDDANGRFQEVGWAQSFDTSGETTRTITWPQGSPPSAGDMGSLEGNPQSNRSGNSREDR